MKILFAIKAMNGASGGAEKVIADVTSGLASRNHDVTLLTFDKPNGNSFYPLHNKIDRICLGLGNPLAKATAAETVTRIHALRKAVKVEKPDIVVAFMHSMFVPMSFALVGTGIPVLGSEHIVPAHYRNKPLEFWLLKKSAHFMCHITVISESIKSLYPKSLEHMISAIPNPVCFPKEEELPDLALPKNRFIILNVGRLEQQKDQKTLISAFSLLVKKYPNWDLRIVGEGQLRNDLQKQIKTLNLERRITLAGITSDIGREYRNADIFALPSRYESFGLATAEAMSFGLPAIGFADCPGTNELIKHKKSGILVEANDDRIASFAQAMATLMESQEKRLHYGAEGKTFVSQYSIEKVVSQWEALIQQKLKAGT